MAGRSSHPKIEAISNKLLHPFRALSSATDFETRFGNVACLPSAQPYVRPIHAPKSIEMQGIPWMAAICMLLRLLC